jgi:DNA-binding NtrC family response regulator
VEPAHVLVVEDKANVLKLMATVLGDRYRVTACASGTEALERLGREAVDVVLTDVRMPGAGGFEVLQAARRHAAAPAVVMMTAWANVSDAVDAMRLGAFDYVAKPLEADEIALVVARAVEHRRDVAQDPGARERAEPPVRQPAVEDAVSFRRAVEEARDRASRDYLTRLMARHRGNVTQAARQAAMTRESLHRVLRRYGIHSERFAGPEASSSAASPAAPDGLRSGGD